MDEKTAHSQGSSQPDRQSFPPRTHPNRPHGGDPGELKSERDDRRYPERCNPRPTRLPLDEEQQGLATRYLPLARSLARRMKMSFPGAGDELQSVAFLALVEAARSFDPSRCVNFATFARLRIWGALCDFRRETITKARAIGGNSGLKVMRLAEESQGGGRLICIQPVPAIGANLEALETFENWIGQLPRQQAEAFRHIYLDGKTQKEAAALVGCSVWTMNRMHSEGLSSLEKSHELEKAHSLSKD